MERNPVGGEVHETLVLRRFGLGNEPPELVGDAPDLILVDKFLLVVRPLWVEVARPEGQPLEVCFNLANARLLYRFERELEHVPRAVLRKLGEARK